MMKGARRPLFSETTAQITVRIVAMAYGGTVRSWDWAAVYPIALMIVG